RETSRLRCLRRAPAKRSGSARALADDLRRFLAGEAVRARPVGRLERGWRWCRRNPTVAALLALVALVLVAGTVVSTLFALDADRGRVKAEGNARTAGEAGARGEGGAA